MNLNPLKKDDNTDALVQALEDANNVDNTQVMQPAADPATDPAMMQQAVTSDGVLVSNATNPDQQAVDALVNQVAEETAAVTPEVAPADPGQAPELAPAPADPAPQPEIPAADSSAALSFNGNDLPAGLSSDPAPQVATNPAPAPTDPAPQFPAMSSDSGDLDGVKKDALGQLRPLIEKLDLEPADKFEKYLMMLRASDDPALIKPAFDAAQSIAGEKEKAQALLDIINEINYITANKQ